MQEIDQHIIGLWIFLGVILFILLVIMAFCLTEFALAINYIKVQYRNKKQREIEPKPFDELPLVTIQIPIFNEKYVVERIIRSCAAIIYPKDRLQIQILDDSNDETVNISKRIVNELKGQGFNIDLIQRTARNGFKAGALRDAMPFCSGEFIAIFDADFIIPANFLNDTLSYFKEEKIGMVQTRWGHLNEHFSILTKIQSFFIDLHFSVQHTGRNAFGYFINFNGTAGIWRKSCILDAGGWSSDTLTEDLDLSYRAQMKGWKFKYREGIASPSELPIHMSGIKSQQFRWIKGGTQVGKKLFFQLALCNASLKQKWFGYTHIFSGMTYLFSFSFFLLSVPLIYLFKTTFLIKSVPYLSIFMLSTLAIMFAGGVSFFNTKHYFNYTIPTFFWRFMLFLLFTMGLSLNNTIAIIEGLLGRKSDFIRTPKFNLTSSKSKNQWSNLSYIARKYDVQLLLEFVLLLYFFFGIFIGIYFHFYHLIPLHVMLVIGYSMIVYFSFKHSVMLK